MNYIINEEKKVVFGWSAKCGCNFVKLIFNYLSGKGITHKMGIKDKDGIGLHEGTYLPLPDNHHKYKIILFIRDPYQRLVSGYVEKYTENREPARMKKWDLPWDKKRTFRAFTNELDKNGLRHINKHHFTPQLSERYKNSHVDKIYDIRNIDFNYLEELFGKQLPEKLLNVKGPHYIEYNKTSRPYLVCDMKYTIYEHDVPTYEYFYDQKIKDKVSYRYRKDLAFFKAHGFDYEQDLINAMDKIKIRKDI